MHTDELISQFERSFGGSGEIRLVRAPGRVNLIGEHTDYNEGFVLPIAIVQELIVAYRVRDDARLRLASANIGGSIVEFALDQPLAPAGNSWTNYVFGVAKELRDAGVRLPGIDAFVCSTIPSGAGLSSSAALEVAIARAWLDAARREMSADEIAKLCQMAEHRFVGVPCGIMDQMIVAAAKRDHAMLLDCRTLQKRFVPIDPHSVGILIVDSRVERRLVSGEYARRRSECEQGVAYFASRDPRVRALRDVTSPALEAAKDELPETLFRRCRHVISENQRTLSAAACLERSDFASMGQLMRAGHESLRDDFEVSLPQLDFLVETAIKLDGVYGARMTGAGFGGCVVVIVRPLETEQTAARLVASYAARYQITPLVYRTNATCGASALVPPNR